MTSRQKLLELLATLKRRAEREKIAEILVQKDAHIVILESGGVTFHPSDTYSILITFAKPIPPRARSALRRRGGATIKMTAQRIESARTGR